MNGKTKEKHVHTQRFMTLSSTIHNEPFSQLVSSPHRDLAAQCELMAMVTVKAKVQWLFRGIR